MEYFSHDSHKHILKLLKVDDYADPKPHLCNICGLAILSSPSYTCCIDTPCNFFLHEPCALNRAGAVIKTKHRSHKHPLVAICREIMSRCDACGEEHRGFFFYCHPCKFWIHQDCAMLPSFVRLRSHFDHPFFLTYSLPLYMLQGGCCICTKTVHTLDKGVYFCGECDALAHLSCAKTCMEDRTTETRLNLIQLPTKGDKFPSLVISKYLSSHPFFQLYESHLFTIKIEDGFNNTNSKELVCDVCIQPITTSSQYYKCQLQPLLQPYTFITHDVCFHHLRRLKFHFGLKPLLHPGPTHIVFRAIFPCFFCRRPCNGFCHHIHNVSICHFFDVECLCAPRTIYHTSHPQHVLFRLPLLKVDEISPSCCSNKPLYFDVYSCTDCNFHIHVSCALLPQSTYHKFDQHPLELITDCGDVSDDRFCEVCEEDISQMHWYYGCRICEFYFHVNCIPEVGFLSKVKFGETLVLEDVHGQHPLTLTRMLMHERDERCGKCKKIIGGFVDELAFNCYDCDFWVHFSCARDSFDGHKTQLARTRSKLYSEVSDTYYKMFYVSASTADAIRSLTM